MASISLLLEKGLEILILRMIPKILTLLILLRGTLLVWLLVVGWQFDFVQTIQISSSMEKKPCKLALLNSYEKTAGTNSSRNEKPSLISNGWTDIQKEASPLRPASARIFLWCL
ncbi:hypothetical protein BDE02_01G218800 [Populus trichocarpa]|nr:hypothetical protein BDE02_01G218800 [Populus trichocarpa]